MPDPTPTDLTEAAHYAYNEAVTVVAQWLHANYCHTDPDVCATLDNDDATALLDTAMPALRRMILAEVDHTIATMPPIRLGDTFRGSIDRALVKVRETIAGVRDA